ncbi:folliculin [Acrasis kona]|uniref:Folliculin n=1 Tax=Acrasis kona TaxID=1008807 RepID=A0AAW2ZCP2_9EUKA
MNNILLFAHFCESDGPSALYCTQSIGNSYLNENGSRKLDGSNTDVSELNDTISKLDKIIIQNTEFVTFDHNMFLSSHQLKPQYISQFKSLSLRALSVEYVGPGREGPVLFGDDNNGYNFAYVFKIKDSKARGFARWFAFLLIDPSLTSLTMSWAFLQKAIFRIVKTIKIRSQEVFLMENSRHQTNNLTSNFLLHRTSSGAAPLTADMFRQKRTQGPLRVLPLLLQYPTFFKELHEWSTAILKAFSEKVSQLPTISECEQIKTTRPIKSLHQLSDLFRTCVTRSFNQSGASPVLSNGSNTSSPTQTKLELSPDTLHRKLMHILLYNVIVGNQIIIRGDDMDLCENVCEILLNCVPSACIRMIRDPSEYQPSYVANFLVISRNVSLPESQVDFTSSLLLDLQANAKGLRNVYVRYYGDTQTTVLGLSLERLCYQRYLETLYIQNARDDLSEEDHYYLYYRYKQKQEVVPNVDLEQSMLTCIKEDWLSKAKLLVKAVKISINSSAVEQLLKLLKLTTRDLPILRYWSTGLWRKNT